MKIRALRGVCVGVDRHLVAGDTTDLEPATVQFLISIRAVEIVKDEAADAESDPKSAPAKAGKKEK